jgi:hypothetical protein
VTDIVLETYQRHWQRVKMSNPGVDTDALMDAFIEGANAFAEANDHPPKREDIASGSPH